MEQSVKLNIETKEDKYRNLCEKYWEFDDFDYKFKNTVNSLAKEYNISTKKITDIVSVSSSITFFCEACGCEIKSYYIRSNINFENLYFRNQCLCQKCKLSGTKNKKINKEEKLFNLEFATKNKKWEKLDNREIELLTIITKCKTKKEVMSQLFNGIKYNNDYSKVIWDRLNRLDDMELIWIERDIDNHIVEFHTDSKLKEILEKEFPQFYSDEDCFGFNKLQIMMKKISSKMTINQPDYSGFFKVKNEVTLKPGVNYGYGAWINEDETIFLKIEPQKKQDTQFIN